VTGPTPQHPRVPLRALLPLVVTMLFWGSAFTASSLAVGHVGHQVAAALRYGVAAIVMVAVLAFTGRGAPPLTRRAWGWMVVAGALGIAIYNGIFFAGLSLAPAIDGSSIMPVMSPVFTAALALIVRRERPTRMRLGALVAGLAGAAFFLRSTTVDAAYPDRVLGDLLFLSAAFIWAIYTLMARRLMSLADPFRVTTWAMVFGGLILAVWAAPALATTDWTAQPPDLWLEILYLAVLPTALGYALYNRGVRDVGPTTASIMMFLVPITGAGMAVLLLGQHLEPGQLLGAITMAVGALLAILSTGARAPKGA
jgi:drug/metabolite transporter (DMT)-like permease